MRRIKRMSRTAHGVLCALLLVLLPFLLWAALEFPAFTPAQGHRWQERRELCGPSEIFDRFSTGFGVCHVAGAAEDTLYFSSFTQLPRVRGLWEPFGALETRPRPEGDGAVLVPMLRLTGDPLWIYVTSRPSAVRAEAELLCGDAFVGASSADFCGDFIRLRFPGGIESPDSVRVRLYAADGALLCAYTAPVA